MLLLTENLENTTEIHLEENEHGKKDWFIEGIYMQSNVKNKNGRIYPKEILGNEINRYIAEKVDTFKALGELNHPQRPSVNPKEASHRIVSLKEDGYNFIGKALILNTPNGNIVKGLLEGGTKIGVSSRGLGSVKSKNGINEVQNDFMLSCVDIVLDPSAPDAMVDGIMEGVEYFMEDGIIVEKVREIIHKTSTKDLLETKVKLFTEIMKSISN